LEYLESASTRYGARILAYCLMTNHYHLLLETPEGNLSQVMRHINGAYTNYFNTKRRRAGHLLQGRYTAILVEQDEYAKTLSRYMHLNPVAARMVERPEEHPRLPRVRWAVNAIKHEKHGRPVQVPGRPVQVPRTSRPGPPDVPSRSPSLV